MTSDRVGIYRTHDSENKFIVVIKYEGLPADAPMHTSNPLASDEAKNFLRHYNLDDTEIDARLQTASALANSLVASR
jgi:hypothetical protein